MLLLLLRLEICSMIIKLISERTRELLLKCKAASQVFLFVFIADLSLTLKSLLVEPTYCTLHFIFLTIKCSI